MELCLDTKFYLITEDNFDKCIIAVLNQIEVFENEIKDLNLKHHESFIYDKEFPPSDKFIIDFSDLNEVFKIIKQKTIQNGNFKHFLSILQQLFLVPDDNNGIDLWKKIVNSCTNLISKKNESYYGENYNTISNASESDNNSHFNRDRNISALEKKVENYEEESKKKNMQIQEVIQKLIYFFLFLF